MRRGVSTSASTPGAMPPRKTIATRLKPRRPRLDAARNALPPAIEELHVSVIRPGHTENAFRQSCAHARHACAVAVLAGRCAARGPAPSPPLLSTVVFGSSGSCWSDRRGRRGGDGRRPPGSGGRPGRGARSARNVQRIHHDPWRSPRHRGGGEGGWPPGRAERPAKSATATRGDARRTVESLGCETIAVTMITTFGSLYAATWTSTTRGWTARRQRALAAG